MLSRFHQALGSLAIVLFVAFAGLAAAQTPQAPHLTPKQRIEEAMRNFDGVEQALKADDLGRDELLRLRERLAPIRDSLDAALGELTPLHEQAEARLSQLPKLEANGPPDTPEVKQQRDQLNREKGEVDGVIGAARVQITRGEQIYDRITDRIRQLFTAQMLERSRSPLSFAFWEEFAGRGLTVTQRTSMVLVRSVVDHVNGTTGWLGVVGALASVGVALYLLRRIRRWVERRFAALSPLRSGVPTNLRRALDAMLTLFVKMAPYPIAVGTFFASAAVFDLVPPRLEPLWQAAMFISVLYGFTRGVSAAVLSPDDGAARLVDVDDPTARVIHNSLKWVAGLFALAGMTQAIEKLLFAPVIFTMATVSMTTLAACVVAAIGLLLERRNADPEDFVGPVDARRFTVSLGWVKPLAWITVAGVIGAVLFGYIPLGAYITGRAFVSVVIVGFAGLLIFLVDATFAEGFSAETRRGRNMARVLGLEPRRLELIGTMLSGILRLALIASTVLILIAPWDIRANAVNTRLEDLFYGLKIGDIRLSVGDFGMALVILVAGLVATRMIRNWLENQVLPRTRLDVGLRNSVATVLGYCGIVLTLVFSLYQLGIDLRNLALVAGALSVGIGFGLQAIVSNFISGLILLAERPIRVGDTIAVKGEEGLVRRISVRSTEISTGDRATVIVPNTDLITSVVTNRTHSDLSGRLIIPVTVPINADPDVVRDLLLEAAKSRRGLMRDPPPRVFFTKFDKDGLSFELRCVVANLNDSLTTKSDLNFDILRRLREKGIDIACTPPTPAVISWSPPPSELSRPAP